MSGKIGQDLCARLEGMLRSVDDTLQVRDREDVPAARPGGPVSFRSYRLRLRRYLAPVLILAIGGIAFAVGRGSRIIASIVLRDETCAFLVSAAANVERLGDDPEAVRRFLGCLIRHPDREAYVLEETGRPPLVVGATDDVNRLLRDAATLGGGPGEPGARLFGIGPVRLRLVGAIPMNGGRRLAVEWRLHGLWTPFTTGVVIFVLLAIGGAVATVAYLSDRIYRPVIDRLRKLEDGLVRYGSGETSVRLEPSPGVRDEFDEVFDAFNRMVRRIGELERERATRIEEERTLLANLAHDINTPITVLRGYAETLLDRGRDLPPEALGRIHGELLEQALYVQAIVEDLLTLASERSAQLRVEPVELDLDELFDNVVDTFQLLASQRGIGLFGDAGGIRVQADPVRLRQILTNLVRNALLHARGATTVELGARREDGEAVIWVEDDGCGVPPEQVDGLFDRYTRGRGRDSVGWGLGLTIVRTLAELHGGTVRYIPRNPGARFEVRLSLGETMEVRG